MVWDLKQKKPWCELRDAGRGAISDIAWNPSEGLQIVTAMGDDANPQIKMWDLRSSTTLPLATLQASSPPHRPSRASFSLVLAPP